MTNSCWRHDSYISSLENHCPAIFSGSTETCPANGECSLQNIDNINPNVTSFTIADGSLSAGENASVTLVFSEAVRGFLSEADITALNGSLSVMTSTDNITWTGVFTPWVDIEDANNTLILSGEYSDVAGNAGVSARSNRYDIDTKTPVVSSFTIADGSLSA